MPVKMAVIKMTKSVFGKHKGKIGNPNTFQNANQYSHYGVQYEIFLKN